MLVEAHDEWQVSAERRYLSERSMALLAEMKPQEEPEQGGGVREDPDHVGAALDLAKPELMTA